MAQNPQKEVREVSGNSIHVVDKKSSTADGARSSSGGNATSFSSGSISASNSVFQDSFVSSEISDLSGGNKSSNSLESDETSHGWLNIQPVSVEYTHGRNLLLCDTRGSATHDSGLKSQGAGFQLASIEVEQSAVQGSATSDIGLLCQGDGLQLADIELEQSAVQGSATSDIGSVCRVSGPHLAYGEDSDVGSSACGGRLYNTQPVISHMCSLHTRSKPRHEIGGVTSQMNLNSWNYYLSFEEDASTREYLHNGILHGFPIVDDDKAIPSYFCDNYASAVTGDAFEFVDNLIEAEILEGKYVPASRVPHCVHALGVI